VRPVTPYHDTTSIVTVGGRVIRSGALQQCLDTECLEITYVLPYNWDLGETSWAIHDHRGDGEMYSVLVTRTDPLKSVGGESVAARWSTPWASAKADANAWVGYTEFGTAHTCADYDSTSYRNRIFRPSVDGVTTVWVAQGKHANYFSREACDGGACSGDVPFGTPCWDNCDSNDFALVYGQWYRDAGPLRNAGGDTCHSHPSIDHYTAFPGSHPSYYSYASYDVWSDTLFGDDDVGRPRALLLPHTVLWWADSHPYSCWPGPTSFPGAPPEPPQPVFKPAPPPAPVCGQSGMCCEFAADGSCSLCAPANGQCP